MFTDRTFEGVRSTPWTAGKYGYVRNAKRAGGKLVYTRFHEGIDIRPARRDKSGEPLDTVSSIASGKVVYTCVQSGRSSYGRYVVVEHNWGSGPFFSLYAHLRSISAKVGQRVSAGGALGKLGYTGRGIDRRRAHVHVELNLLLNGRFEKWHGLHYRTPNYHGIYNGLNMAGIDIAGLFHAHRADPSITLPGFISRMQTYYKVVLPRGAGFDLVKRYPWLLKGGRKQGESWEVSFSRSGVPLRVTGSPKRVRYPAVVWVRSSPYSHGWNTRGRLTGSGAKAVLSSGGSRYIQLVGGSF